MAAARRGCCGNYRNIIDIVLAYPLCGQRLPCSTHSYPDELRSPSLEEITHIPADQVSDQLGSAIAKLSQEEQERFAQARNAGHTLSLVNILLVLARDYTPLLLIDNAENIPSSDWSILESQLIEPLVSAGQSLIVVAGRRQVLNWKCFEVRRRVMEPDKSHVGAFDEETVTKQIHQHAYDVPVELIFPYTGGNPMLAKQPRDEEFSATRDVRNM